MTPHAGLPRRARRPARLDEDDLITFARERFAAHKVPKPVHFAPAVPKNASGKLLKRELRAELAEPLEKSAATRQELAAKGLVGD